MYAQLVNNLDELGFTEVEPYLSEYLSKAAKEGIALQDALLEISDRELSLRNHRAAQIQVSVSHFPYIKTLDEYDYHFQPSVNKAEIKDLALLRFLEQKENILFFSTPGTGKTHLATAIRIEAAKKRNITYFITCHDLIQTLRKAHDENRFEARLKHFAKYRLLIIDEIGLILALAQSKRNTFRPEKEVEMLKALTSNEFKLTKEEVADSFTTALATADKMLSNVPSTMKSLEESHGCQPIDHNIVRRGRRRIE